MYMSRGSQAIMLLSTPVQFPGIKMPQGGVITTKYVVSLFVGSWFSFTSPLYDGLLHHRHKK